MAIEVFNRYEKKYLIDEVTFKSLLNRISDYMELDKYNKNGQFYSISNIYYDTDDNRLIRSSIEKPVYKEKLRMRSYGTPNAHDKVFLEIKKKYNGIVNKRRTSIVLKDAYRYMENGTFPYETECLNRQVLKEIDYFRSIYDLKPKVYLSYDRYAFFEKNDGDFRVTFDTNITTRRGDVPAPTKNSSVVKMLEFLFYLEVCKAPQGWIRTAAARCYTSRRAKTAAARKVPCGGCSHFVESSGKITLRTRRCTRSRTLPAAS